MLFGIDPLLTPELLAILAEMGHGDEIVISDANFPSVSCGNRVVQLTGVDAPEALKAITALMPLDTLVDAPARTMQVVGEPDAVPETVAMFDAILEALPVTPTRSVGVERMAFYEEARKAYAIVRTGERRHYGNIILKKGVIAPG